MLRSVALFALLLTLAALPAQGSALRTFDTHAVRETISLDGRWDFRLLGADQELVDRALEVTGGKIAVPSAWEKIPGLENFRGQAELSTRIEAERGKAVRIVFGGVSHTGEVYIDGKLYGSHYDAYTPWAVVAADLAPGGHTLKVKVDNTFGEHSALHISNDYYTWGGITRPVELQQVPMLYLEHIRANPVMDNGAWALELEVFARNCGDAKLSGRVSVALETGASINLGEIKLKAGESGSVKGRLACPDVSPWSGETPNLYLMTATLSDFEGREFDDLIDRVGFRRVEVRGREILVNGQPVRLRGFNRHESHPAFGCAIPPAAMTNDLLIMRDLGSNFVRTSHYPNDMRFLDLCDEMGLYVWEESHSRNIDFGHPKFREQIAGSTEEMIEWHFNHPGIIMWGSLNECQSETAVGREVYGYVLGLIKKLDPDRPVTSASNRYMRDITLEYVDIVSWNIYTGWYGRDLDGIGPFLEELLTWQDTANSNAAGKPVILSEFGAGALYGYRDPAHPKWSEEYQCDLLDASLEVYLNHPSVSGVAIWQFCDIRICDGWWNGRPRTMNNKGVVDEFRRPKLSYPLVKRKFMEARRKWDKR